jgi:hypothetical protein
MKSPRWCNSFSGIYWVVNYAVRMAAVSITSLPFSAGGGCTGESWHSRSTLAFAGVEAFEGPAVCQGAVEAFDLAVGLRPVGAGAFGSDPGLGAGLTTQTVAVGRAVVRRTRSTWTPSAAYQATARRSTATAVVANSSSWISA